MMRRVTSTTFCLLVSLLLAWTSIGSAAPVGPVFPLPGGSPNFSSSGGPAAAVGGVTFNFTNFDTSVFSNLWYGPDPAFLPSAGLSSSLSAFTSLLISGTTATWSGTTAWTNPSPPGGTNPNVPWEFRINITGLGANPWQTAASAGLDPGVGAGIGAVANNPSGLDFSANLQFLANVGSGFQALNTIQQGPPGGQTRSSVGTGLYFEPAAVPAPSAMLLMGTGLLGLVGWRWWSTKTV